MASRLSVKQCQICHWQYRGGYCPYCKCVKLEHQITKLVDVLQNLFDWYDYDPNCIDNCPACIAYADAKEILDQAGK